MRLTGIRLPLLAALACASVGLFVWATDRSYGDTVYVLPTRATVSVSTPYVIPTSYVVPSSYVFPSYIESSYTVSPAVSLLPTGYIETTYRRGLFGRRWVVERPVVAAYSTAYLPTTYVSSYVPTTYVAPTYYSTSYRVRSYRPTSYYLPTTYYRPTTYSYIPTVYETAYSTPADICCDEVVADSTVRTVPQSSGGAYAPSRGAKEVQSGSMEGDAYDSYVNTPLPGEPGTQRSTLRGDAATKAQSKIDTNGADSPPNPPSATPADAAESKAAAKGSSGGTQKNAPSQKSGGTPESKKANTPAAPADNSENIDLRPAPGDGGVLRYESQRPNYARLRGADRRNVLFGTVETEDGRPRGEVPVIVVNRSRSSIRHNGVSDAFGGFAIHVPDGQWTVRVAMPSGSTQAVRDITVTNGTIMDNAEAVEVRNLIISY